MEDVLKSAQSLYNEKKWEEAIQLLDGNLSKFTKREDIAEMQRIKGWCWYYIGIKGPVEEKNRNLDSSKACFKGVLAVTSDSIKKVSAMNGLPLVLWNLDERTKAWDISNQAIEYFSEEPSAWNTRSILYRWAKDLKESIEMCEKAYETALYRRDYRTAGNAKSNKAAALIALGYKDLARDEYAAALGLYKEFEEYGGESAKFHIEEVVKKIKDLS